MTRDWTDETLAALADGELPADEAEALRAAIADDPEALRRLQRIERSSALLREAFAAPLAEPVPPAIRGALDEAPGRVVPFRRRARAWVPAAAAACLAIAVGIGGGVMLGSGDADRLVVAAGDAPLGGPLHAALETLPSGSVSDAGLRPMLTFRDAAGRPCREFEHASDDRGERLFGIACRTEERSWHVESVVAAPETVERGPGYAPASGPGAAALDATLDALGAGPALGPEAERRLLDAGWP